MLNTSLSCSRPCPLFVSSHKGLTPCEHSRLLLYGTHRAGSRQERPALLPRRDAELRESPETQSRQPTRQATATEVLRGHAATNREIRLYKVLSEAVGICVCQRLLFSHNVRRAFSGFFL